MAGVKVIQWVVAHELHADAGASESHSHYHMALKLEKRARWLKVRKFLDDGYGIKVNFNSNHNTYYSATNTQQRKIEIVYTQRATQTLKTHLHRELRMLFPVIKEKQLAVLEFPRKESAVCPCTRWVSSFRLRMSNHACS